MTQTFFYNLSDYGNSLIQTATQMRGGHSVVVTRLSEHCVFYTVSSYKPKLRKECVRELRSVGENFSVEVKDTSDLLNLTFTNTS